MTDRHPVWAIVTKARATYLKPLWEGFAGAQPAHWRTRLIWPRQHASEHPETLVTPAHERLEILPIECRLVDRGGRAGRMGVHHSRQYTSLPSREMLRALWAPEIRGVLIHEYSPFTLAGLACARARGLPVAVLTDVGTGNAGMFSLPVRMWHTFWSLWVHGVVAGCPAARTPLSRRKLPWVDACHAVDASVYRPRERGAARQPVFAYSGQFIHRKGIDLFFKAAARLRADAGDAFRIRMIGWGDEAWARGLAADAGLNALIDWRPFLSGNELVDALGSADVFVLPSRQDSYGVVAHEAACLGMPLLLSRHAGAADTLALDGRTGWRIDPENTEAFALRLLALLDPALRRRMGAEARALGEQLSSPRRGAAVWKWLNDTFLTEAKEHAATAAPVGKEALGRS